MKRELACLAGVLQIQKQKKTEKQIGCLSVERIQ